MKTCIAVWIAVVTFSNACPLLAAPSPAPAAPAALEPLQPKVEKNSSYDGWLLRARAEQPLTEEQWKAIEGFDIKGLAIGGKGINDDAIARLSKLQLTVLALDGASTLTDACCQHLAKMTSLRRLSMGHMLQKEFTGKTLSLLKDLPNLESLGLGGSATGNEAMEAIGQLTQLKDLRNWHTRHDDPRNLYLLKLTNLKSLQLGRNCASHGKKVFSALTNATLDTLAQMKSLETLTLMEFRPNLAALEKLRSLPNLKTLDLSSSVDIPADDVKKLAAEMPNVKVRSRAMTDAERKHLDLSLKDDVAHPEANSAGH